MPANSWSMAGFRRKRGSPCPARSAVDSCTPFVIRTGGALPPHDRIAAPDEVIWLPRAVLGEVPLTRNCGTPCCERVGHGDKFSRAERAALAAGTALRARAPSMIWAIFAAPPDLQMRTEAGIVGKHVDVPSPIPLRDEFWIPANPAFRCPQDSSFLGELPPDGFEDVAGETRLDVVPVEPPLGSAAAQRPDRPEHSLQFPQRQTQHCGERRFFESCQASPLCHINLRAILAGYHPAVRSKLARMAVTIAGAGARDRQLGGLPAPGTRLPNQVRAGS